MFKLMKRSEVKLRTFLNAWENNGKKESVERFGILESIFNVDKKIINNSLVLRNYEDKYAE